MKLEGCTTHLKITSQQSFHTSLFPVNDDVQFKVQILIIFILYPMNSWSLHLNLATDALNIHKLQSHNTETNCVCPNVNINPFSHLW